MKNKAVEFLNKLRHSLKPINLKDMATRALWTFLQAFMATYILAGDSLIDLLFNGSWSAFISLMLATGVAGIAAGLSALKTLLVELIKNYKAQ